jgi:biopolymer transport protein TolR
MNYLLSVCLVASTLATNVTPYASAQSSAMRQGVSVQMAKTTNATPMPDADNEDACIVAVTAEGRLFFGVKPVTPESLAEEMKTTPRHRDQGLYIKADARASFDFVEKVLNAAKRDLFESAVLLTNQNEAPALGKMVAPKGLEVLLTSAPSDAVVVELNNSGQPRPALKVNNQEIAWSDLQTTLNQSLQNRSDRIVEIKAEGSLPFAQVAQVIDACGSIKATVVLPAEE